MKNRLTLVTVATHKTHELDRFIESAKYHGYDYVILGLGMEWTGGVADNGRLVFPGGGMKVNLLKEYLSTYVGSNSDVILFTDSYDVVFNEKPDELLSRWNGNVLFTAEKTCWPDRDLEEEYPNSPYGYKYLNSGCYIGTAKALHSFISLPITEPANGDDQLHCQVGSRCPCRFCGGYVRPGEDLYIMWAGWSGRNPLCSYFAYRSKEAGL